MEMAPNYDVSAAIQSNLYDVKMASGLDINSARNNKQDDLMVIPGGNGDNTFKAWTLPVRHYIYSS